MNISYLIYTTGQIQIKMDKNPITQVEVRQDYTICSLKREEEEETRSSEK